MTVVLPGGTRVQESLENEIRLLAFGATWGDPVPSWTPTRVTGRKARVLAVVHGWMPTLAAGSERMMQHLLDALPKDEFDIEVLSFGVANGQATDLRTTYVYDGLDVTQGYAPRWAPDVIVYHHVAASRAMPALQARFPDAPAIAVHHNDRFHNGQILGVRHELDVVNTRWVKDSLSITDGLVVHPPLEERRHSVGVTGDSVTLVNLSPDKGVETFALAAWALPDHPFLGVTGTHGEQRSEFASNVRVVPTTDDMRSVWRSTKVVLMPSVYESYGMVAAEASLNGIPVIAHPTPGLIECLGGAGVFIDRDDVEGYVRALRLLLTDEDHYRERSQLAALRGRELAAQSQQELPLFVDAVRGLLD